MEKCTICEKEFERAAAVSRHKLIHSTESKFQCPVCNKCFNRSDNMKRHIKGCTKRKLAPDLKCSRYNKVFTTKFSLKRHDKEQPLCNESNLRKNDCNLPIEDNGNTEASDFTCNFCQNTFSTKHSLVCHKKIMVCHSFVSMVSAQVPAAQIPAAPFSIEMAKENMMKDVLAALISVL